MSEGDPVLGKEGPHPGWDHKPMTWARFLRLRSWAQQAAERFSADVYLVGSVLEKATPRDIDVAVIWPKTVYEERFGSVPEHGGTPEMGKHIADVKRTQIWLDAYVEIQQAVRWATRVDMRFCPDTWWTDKPRLLLAKGR